MHCRSLRRSEEQCLAPAQEGCPGVSQGEWQRSAEAPAGRVSVLRLQGRLPPQVSPAPTPLQINSPFQIQAAACLKGSLSQSSYPMPAFSVMYCTMLGWHLCDRVAAYAQDQRPDDINASCQIMILAFLASQHACR